MVSRPGPVAFYPSGAASRGTAEPRYGGQHTVPTDPQKQPGLDSAKLSCTTTPLGTKWDARDRSRGPDQPGHSVSRHHTLDHSPLDPSDWKHPIHRDARRGLSIELEVEERRGYLEEEDGRMILPQSVRRALAHRTSTVPVSQSHVFNTDATRIARMEDVPYLERRRVNAARDVIRDEEMGLEIDLAPLSDADLLRFTEVLWHFLMVLCLGLVAWWLMRMGAWSWL